MTPAQAKRLRTRIREFEDRKISSADLGREIFSAAREVVNPSELRLRQTLEKLGNRVTVLSEQALMSSVRSEVLAAADEVNAELAEFGY